MKDSIIEIKEQDGKIKKYDILFKFDELDNNESYIVYTDYSRDSDGNLNVFARLYQNESGRAKLTPIKNDEVKCFIDEKLNELLQNITIAE